MWTITNPKSNAGKANNHFSSSQMESGPLEEQQIAFIVAEVIKGLDYLHSLGIWHGNVESRQVMLTPSGEVKLAGFHFATDMLGAPGDAKWKDDRCKVNTFPTFNYICQ